MRRVLLDFSQAMPIFLQDVWVGIRADKRVQDALLVQIRWATPGHRPDPEKQMTLLHCERLQPGIEGRGTVHVDLQVPGGMANAGAIMAGPMCRAHGWVGNWLGGTRLLTSDDWGLEIAESHDMPLMAFFLDDKGRCWLSTCPFHPPGATILMVPATVEERG